MLVRRDVLERLGGFDEGFFMYCEDMDLCRRIAAAGYDVRYEPEAMAAHAAARRRLERTMLPVLAASRIRYARKHRGVAAAYWSSAPESRSGAARIGLVGRGGWPVRRGHCAHRCVPSRQRRPRATSRSARSLSANSGRPARRNRGLRDG